MAYGKYIAGNTFCFAVSMESASFSSQCLLSCRPTAYTVPVCMWLASSLCCCRGFLGSGICVFSRYPILETVEHRFPLNGHPQKILHGDFYGNKACGLLILKVKDLTVNLYTTHVSLYSEFKYSERVLFSSEFNIRYFCWKSNLQALTFLA